MAEQHPDTMQVESSSLSIITKLARNSTVRVPDF